MNRYTICTHMYLCESWSWYLYMAGSFQGHSIHKVYEKNHVFLKNIFLSNWCSKLGQFLIKLWVATNIWKCLMKKSRIVVLMLFCDCVLKLFCRKIIKLRSPTVILNHMYTLLRTYIFYNVHWHYCSSCIHNQIVMSCITIPYQLFKVILTCLKFA